MDTPSYQQLLRENQQLRQENARLLQTIRQLEQRIDELDRTSKRQAAPFSKNQPKDKPKKPGRKAGQQHGDHAHREPPPDKVDETVDAPLPKQCPDCGGDIVEDHVDQQFQTEIPRQPILRQINIHCGQCQQCGKTVRGRHPLQTSDATGAAASQLGADAQAAVVYLNKRAGMSHGKIAATMQNLFGITLSRGACAQIVMRTADKLRPVYAQIQERLIDSDYLTPDETGWRIGGRLAWLHAWVGDEGATLYSIDPQRSAEVLEQIIGSDWSGTMTHDGFSSYDRFQDALHQQCVDHALRRARGLVERQTGTAKIFAQQVIELFTQALRRRDRLNDQEADADRRDRVYQTYVARLCDLTARPRVNAANQRFAKHLYHHASNWFVFLLDPALPATNHRAEQALKTPIVNRKVWGGNRTAAGGEAQAVHGSVLETCKNLGVNAYHYLSNAVRGVLGKLFR